MVNKRKLALADKKLKQRSEVLGISGIYDARPKKLIDMANALIEAGVP